MTEDFGLKLKAKRYFSLRQDTKKVIVVFFKDDSKHKEISGGKSEYKRQSRAITEVQTKMTAAQIHVLNLKWKEMYSLKDTQGAEKTEFDDRLDS